MLPNKIRSELNKIQNNFRKNISNLGLSFNYFLFVSVALLAITFLSLNIYKTVRRAELNYELKQQEQEKRDKLYAELQDLKEKAEYSESIDAKRNLAVDGYKLAPDGEKLYRVEQGEVQAVYLEEQEIEPVDLDKHEFWWKFLIFGSGKPEKSDS